MGFERVSILLAQEKSVPSADEWDAVRSEEFGIITGGVQRARPHDTVMRAVQEMHWISLACFLEQCIPTKLSLVPELASRVTIEVSQLSAFDPLEAYAISLERLCDNGGTDVKGNHGAYSGGQDASH